MWSRFYMGRWGGTTAPSSVQGLVLTGLCVFLGEDPGRGRGGGHIPRLGAGTCEGTERSCLWPCLSPLENVGVKHNPYSGPSLHNQKSGRPREPGALPTGRSPTAEGCQAPLYTNQSLSQPHLGTDLCLRLVRIAPSIGQRLLSTRAL